MIRPLFTLLLLVHCGLAECKQQVEGCGKIQTLKFRDRTVHYIVPCAPEGTFPMMIALHGMGAKAEMEIVRYEEAAENALFMLVAPQGVWGSWNAPECCGKSKKKRIADVVFIRDLIAKMATVTGVHSGKTVVTGYSNGAFLSMELARDKTVPIVAAAAMAGYNYGHNMERSLPVLLHHSLDDGFVLSTGCCQGSKCAFGLDANPQCVPTSTWHSRWAAKNHCTAKKATKATFHADTDQAFECFKHDCKEATILCHHKVRRHMDWAYPSPEYAVEKHIINFFKDEICKASGGLVLPATQKLPKRCKCLNRAKGMYCDYHPDGPNMNFLG